MSHGIEAVTKMSLGLALDAAALQYKAIASNIANAQVDGYSRMQVDFSSQLENARQEISANGTTSLSTLENIEPRLLFQPSFLGGFQKIRIDMEMADLAQNSIHYQALIKGLNRHFSILNSAINEGKK